MNNPTGDIELPYDQADKQSIYSYALGLTGTTLRSKLKDDNLTYSPHNKGSFGAVVESSYFFIDANNVSRADFAAAGIELKTTPLKRNKNGALSAKERLVIGMIDYMTVVNETFMTSHFMEKAREILLISYLWTPDTSPLDYHIELVQWVRLTELPQGDLAQIKADWETVVTKVRNGLAHELSGSDTLYLEACTKSSSSQVRRKQPFSDIPAKPRAWALKASFMTVMSNRFINSMEPIERKAGEETLTVLELVHNRFSPFFGLTEHELGIHFGYLTVEQDSPRSWPKNLRACITRRILGVSQDAKIEEFEKAAIKPKTIRINRNGTPKESMSFPAFDYFKLTATPFEKSSFFSQIHQRYLFVIFREDFDNPGTFRLSNVALWQMPENDFSEAQRCYEEMRKRVIEGHAENSVKSSENRCCHVRPHDTKTSKPLPTPQGAPMKRKSFWFNAQYLKDEIARITSTS